MKSLLIEIVTIGPRQSPNTMIGEDCLARVVMGDPYSIAVFDSPPCPRNRRHQPGSLQSTEPWHRENDTWLEKRENGPRTRTGLCLLDRYCEGQGVAFSVRVDFVPIVERGPYLAETFHPHQNKRVD